MKQCQWLYCATFSLMLFGCMGASEEVPLGKVERPDIEYKFTFRPARDLDYWRLKLMPTGNEILGNIEIRFKTLNETIIYATSPTATQEYLEKEDGRLAYTGPIMGAVSGRSIVMQRTPPGRIEVEISVKVFGIDAGKGLPLTVSMVHEPKPL